MYEKSLEMRHFLVFHYPEEPKLARSWAAGVALDGKIEQTAPMVAVGCIIDVAQDAKTEILSNLALDKRRPISKLFSTNPEPGE